MVTFTGKLVNPLDLTPQDVDIRDIAHHLSNMCRWQGATRHFYSVAEHCVHVSRLVPTGYALLALLHDAAEAYMGDAIRPIKRRLMCAERISDG